MSFGDDHTCHIEGISIVRIKLFDGMVGELKDVRHAPQLKKNVILIGALEAQALRETLGENILKMFSDSLVVLKGIRCNNLYYLKCNVIIENLATSECLDDDSIRLWNF